MLNTYEDYSFEEFFNSNNEEILEFISESRKKSIERVGENWKGKMEKSHKYEHRLENNDNLILIYEDLFLGREKFQGEEVLFLEYLSNKKQNREMRWVPLWKMSILGSINEDYSGFGGLSKSDLERKIKEIFNFLKVALLESQKYDIRGPRKYKKDNYFFRSETEKNKEDWNFFKGDITITYAGERLYSETYMGGIPIKENHKMSELFN